MGGLINRVKEITGIYGLGFERESMMGIGATVGFVVVVGGLGALVNWLFL